MNIDDHEIHYTEFSDINFVTECDYSSPDKNKSNTLVYFNGRGPLLEACRANSEEGWVDIVWILAGSDHEPMISSDTHEPIIFRIFGHVEIIKEPKEYRELVEELYG